MNAFACRGPRVGLTIAVLGVCLAVGFVAPARAADDGGWAETNTNLAIVPENDPFESSLPANYPLEFVHMPVTKRITKITIGDLRYASCSIPVKVKLKIEYHSDGDPWGTPDAPVVESVGSATLSTVASKVSWQVPPTDLRKGRAYAFKIAVTSGSCSSSLRRTTWSSSGPVYSGDVACALAATDIGWWRMNQHMSDVPDNACNAYNWDHTMPRGWMVVKPCSVGACREVIVRSRSDGFGSCAIQGWDAGGVWKIWRPTPGVPGKYDYVCMWNQYAEVGHDPKPPARGWHYAGVWHGHTPGTSPPRQGKPRDMYLILETVDYGALVQAHGPKLLYDSNESYFADRADTAIDAPENRLVRRPDDLGNQLELLADHNLAPPRKLGRSLINSWYPSGFPVSEPSENDAIAYSGDNYVIASGFHAEPYYADQIYGRAKHGGDGKLWLQYWMFYYYNDFEYAGIGTHEGDWEMIQVGLDGANQPEVVTYASHEGGQSCDYDIVKDPAAQGTPRVWVADGSHASYPRAGSSGLPGANPATDQHWGNGYNVKPDVETVTGEIGEIWGWPGRWGESFGSLGEAPSPPAPRKQGAKWDDPSEFAAEAGKCQASLQGARRRGGERPRAQVSLPKPSFTAERAGEFARVRYGVNTKRLPKGTRLRTVVRSSDESQPASSVYRTLRSGKGAIRARMPHGAGPHRVELSLWDRRNRFGPLATAVLP